MKTKSGKRVRTKRPVRKPARKKIARSNDRSRVFGQFLLPLFIFVCISICLGALGYLGYQKVSASDFFEMKRVEIVGAERSSKTSIESIVRTEAERPGVWRVDLADLKLRVEKLPFVKTAAVTRVLPGGIRVQIVERQPMAIVTRGGKNYLVDSEGSILAASEKTEENLPFAIIGWDEAKTEKSYKENIERVKVYQKMLGDWRAANLLSKVQAVNLVNLHEPKAMITDSGLPVAIAVGRDNFSENLSNGIRAIVGKGNMFEGVDLVGSNMILAPRKQN
ncbi:MAG: cell division protein FtsQ/DivIB [Pyrinomonadaceae bacterium]